MVQDFDAFTGETVSKLFGVKLVTRITLQIVTVSLKLDNSFHKSPFQVGQIQSNITNPT